QGKLDEAVAQYTQALTLRPDLVKAHYNLGVVLREKGKLDEAVALREQGQLDEAVAHYQRALALEPEFAEAHCNLGDWVRGQGKLDEAVARFRQALASRPDCVTAHISLGNALREQGLLTEAVACYRQALNLNPRSAAGNQHLGAAWRMLGRLTEARNAYERAIELAPRKPVLHLALAQLKRFTPGDADLAALEKLACEPASLSAEDRMQLGFALGKAYRDVGDYERSLRHLFEANALKRQQIVYDETARLGHLDRIREVFTPEVMHDKRGLGNASLAPVFIVGMPRSGTTLIEQILASHPRVFGA